MLRLNRAFACMAVFAVAAAAAHGDERPSNSEHPSTSDHVINLKSLGIAPECFTFLPDNRSALLVSNQDQQLVVLNVLDPSVRQTIPYGPTLAGASFSVMRVDPNGRFVLLIGASGDKKNGIIAQLDLEAPNSQLKVRSIPELVRPSAAVSGRGEIVVGDQTSRTVTVLRNADLGEVDSYASSRSDLGRSIFLKSGPPTDLGISRDGRFIVVSHASVGALSLIDQQVGEVVDTLGAGSRTPLAMVVQEADREIRGTRPTRVVFADIDEDAFVTALVDPGFQKFKIVEVAKLDLEPLSEKRVAKDSPTATVILAASSTLETIVVGTRNDTKMLIRTPVFARITTLSSPPDDIQVTRDGKTIAVLDTSDGSLRVIENPVLWASQTGAAAGSDRIREAQKLLSDLRFPIDQVDGIDGPATRRAVKLFQVSTKLPPSGLVDTDTLQRIRKVADEPRQPCVPIEEADRCESRRVQVVPGLNSGETTEQRFCVAQDRTDTPIQVDSYRTKPDGTRYDCTRHHSCAFLRFRELLAYERLCLGPSGDAGTAEQW